MQNLSEEILGPEKDKLPPYVPPKDPGLQNLSSRLFLKERKQLQTWTNLCSIGTPR
jgi:hypothetical protein